MPYIHKHPELANQVLYIITSTIHMCFIDELASVVTSIPQLPRLSSQIVLDELWDLLGKAAFQNLAELCTMFN